MNIWTLPNDQLTPLLERMRRTTDGGKIPTIPLDMLLRGILEKANEFVPSNSGSILLDDPYQKLQKAEDKELIFVCCFGDTAQHLIGDRISSHRGIAGKVYGSGISILTNDTRSIPEFCNEYDKRYGFDSKSILCVPIRIGQAICGVIELMNKMDSKPYDLSEKELLEIFAGYISSTIQNAIDAKKMEKMVRTDDLSGLGNDRYLHEKLPEEVSRHLAVAKPFSIIFLDLDNFKSVNDKYGHLVGSQLLAEYGQLLASVVTQKSATLTRYGGDEYVILLPETDLKDAIRLAEKIRLTTQEHVFLTGTSKRSQKPLNIKNTITASIGLSTFDPTTATVDANKGEEVATKLLQAADTAMYDSKALGKNHVTTVPIFFE